MHDVSVEHEVAVGSYLAVVSEQEHLGVEVELRAAVERVDVPAEYNLTGDWRLHQKLF